MTGEETSAVNTALWYGPWLSAGAILVSAAIGATIALYSISVQRAIARKRATLDLVSAMERDATYIQCRKTFITLRIRGNLAQWGDPKYRSSDEVVAIRNALNDYELIAIGIREDVLDEALYRRWFETSLKKDWEAAKPFADAIRNEYGTTSLFSELEWLYTKWAN